MDEKKAEYIVARVKEARARTGSSTPEMVERVARALCIAEDGEPDRTWSDGKPEWQMWTAAAGAAIETIRDPSSSMITAALVSHLAQTKAAAFRPFLVWQAMIDDALKAPDS